MIDAAVRAPVSQPTEEVVPKSPGPDPKLNDKGVVTGEDDIEPIIVREEGGRSVVLDALNITDRLMVLPEEVKQNVNEVKGYVKKVMEQKGMKQTVGAFKKVLGEVKGEMGLDEEADPAIVLDRIAGVVKAWKNLSFISDPSEKRKIFMKLANLKSSKDMNREVFRLMENYKVWR